MFAYVHVDGGPGDNVSGDIGFFYTFGYNFGNLMNNFLLTIWSGLAGIVDVLESIFFMLAGVVPVFDSGDGVLNQNNDFVTTILNSGAVQRIFGSLVAVAIVLLVFFTILQLIRSQYKEKMGGNPYTTVFKMVKGMVMFLFITAGVIVGLQVTGMVFNVLNAATRGGENRSVAGMIFSNMSTHASVAGRGPQEDLDGSYRMTARRDNMIFFAGDTGTGWTWTWTSGRRAYFVSREDVNLAEEIIDVGEGGYSPFFHLGLDQGFVQQHLFTFTRRFRTFRHEIVTQNYETEENAWDGNNNPIGWEWVTSGEATVSVGDEFFVDGVSHSFEISTETIDQGTNDNRAFFINTLGHSQLETDISFGSDNRVTNDAISAAGNTNGRLLYDSVRRPDPDAGTSNSATFVGEHARERAQTALASTIGNIIATYDRLIELAPQVNIANTDEAHFSAFDGFFPGETRFGNLMQQMAAGGDAGNPRRVASEALTGNRVPAIALPNSTAIVTNSHRIELERVQVNQVHILQWTDRNDVWAGGQEFRFGDIGWEVFWVRENGQFILDRGQQGAQISTRTPLTTIPVAATAGRTDVPLNSDGGIGVGDRNEVNRRVIAEWIADQMASRDSPYSLFQGGRGDSGSDAFLAQHIGPLNFRSNRVIRQLYLVGEINLIIGLLGIFITIGVFLNFAFGLVQRAVELSVLYMVSPLTVAFYPFDDGQSFSNGFVRPFYKKAIAIYSIVMAVNLFFVLWPVLNRIQFFNPDEPWGMSRNVMAGLIVNLAMLSMMPAIRTQINSMLGADNIQEKKLGQVFRDGMKSVGGPVGVAGNKLADLGARGMKALSSPYKSTVKAASAIRKSKREREALRDLVDGAVKKDDAANSFFRNKKIDPTDADAMAKARGKSSAELLAEAKKAGGDDFDEDDWKNKNQAYKDAKEWEGHEGNLGAAAKAREVAKYGRRYREGALFGKTEVGKFWKGKGEKGAALEKYKMQEALEGKWNEDQKGIMEYKRISHKNSGKFLNDATLAEKNIETYEKIAEAARAEIDAHKSPWSEATIYSALGIKKEDVKRAGLQEEFKNTVGRLLKGETLNEDTAKMFSGKGINMDKLNIDEAKKLGEDKIASVLGLAVAEKNLDVANAQIKINEASLKSAKSEFMKNTNFTGDMDRLEELRKLAAADNSVNQRDVEAYAKYIEQHTNLKDMYYKDEGSKFVERTANTETAAMAKEIVKEIARMEQSINQRARNALLSSELTAMLMTANDGTMKSAMGPLNELIRELLKGTKEQTEVFKDFIKENGLKDNQVTLKSLEDFAQNVKLGSETTTDMLRFTELFNTALGHTQGNTMGNTTSSMMNAASYMTDMVFQEKFMEKWNNSANMAAQEETQNYIQAGHQLTKAQSDLEQLKKILPDELKITLEKAVENVDWTDNYKSENLDTLNKAMDDIRGKFMELHKGNEENQRMFNNMVSNIGSFQNSVLLAEQKGRDQDAFFGMVQEIRNLMEFRRGFTRGGGPG